jgi:hypothetical protein
MTQQAPKTTGIPQMIGLFVFVGTAAFFIAALANVVLAGLGDVQQWAVAFSYLVAVMALVVMFLDVYDLWVRGRKFSSQAARSFRMIALVAIIASMAATLMGKNTVLVILFMPSVLIYYMTMRPTPSASRRTAQGATGRASGGGASRAGSGGGKSRQRKGGKKHR